jgi:hypothetical protein
MGILCVLDRLACIVVEQDRGRDGKREQRRQQAPHLAAVHIIGLPLMAHLEGAGCGVWTAAYGALQSVTQRTNAP